MSCEVGLRRAQDCPMNNLIRDLQSWSCRPQIVTYVHLASHIPQLLDSFQGAKFAVLSVADGLTSELNQHKHW